MDKITVSKICENQNKIKELSANSENLRKSNDTERWHIKYDIYEPKIRALQSELNESITKLDNETKTKQDQITSNIKELNQVINQSKRIIQFLQLNVNNQDLTINDDNIIVRDNYRIETHKESLGVIFQDSGLLLKAYIISNKKPSNKYSLVVYGNCVFYPAYDYDNPLLKIPHDYIDNAYVSKATYRIESSIKDMPTIADLKAWFDKNKSKILADFIKEYQTVKAEYEQIKQTYSLSDFEALKTWVCPECGKFYTIFDDFATHYEPDCNNHNPVIKMNKVIGACK